MDRSDLPVPAPTDIHPANPPASRSPALRPPRGKLRLWWRPPIPRVHIPFPMWRDGARRPCLHPFTWAKRSCTAIALILLVASVFWLRADGGGDAFLTGAGSFFGRFFGSGQPPAATPSETAGTEAQASTPRPTDSSVQTSEPMTGDAPADGTGPDASTADPIAPSDSPELPPPSVEPPADTDTPNPPPPDASVPAETFSLPATAPTSGTSLGEPPATTEPPPPSTVPAGCYPLCREDRSEPLHGAGYIINTAGELPAALPNGRLWKGADAPCVLIIHTRPLEGYGDGGDWYDPATGGLAVADSPDDPDGVVAIGTALTRYLRGRSLRAIHLRLPVETGESSASIRARTEAAIRDYCRLYPSIELVLDIGRSAELTAEGGVLTPVGTWRGETCAQLRFSVIRERAEPLGADDTFARRLSMALRLRASLWVTEPTLSRPVWVKSGYMPEGLPADVAYLSVDVGAAGNTFAEAERLVVPLGQAVAVLLTTDS